MITRAPKKETPEAHNQSFISRRNGAAASQKNGAVLLKMRPDLIDRITAQASALGMPRTAYIISTVVADMDRRAAHSKPKKMARK